MGATQVRTIDFSARRLHLRMTLHGSARMSCYQERSVRVSVYKTKALLHLSCQVVRP
jgi:hypothetical protein